LSPVLSLHPLPFLSLILLLSLPSPFILHVTIEPLWISTSCCSRYKYSADKFLCQMAGSSCPICKFVCFFYFYFFT
jgi:hypothetical protein